MEHEVSAITEEGTITIQPNMDIAEDKENDHVEEPELQSKINGSSQKRKHSSSFNLNNTSGSRKKLSDVLSPSYSQIMIDWQKGREAHDEARLEWDKQKWNEERSAQIMQTEQQRLMKEMEIAFEWEKNAECRKLEQSKIQSQLNFDMAKEAKKLDFEKEKWQKEVEMREKQQNMDLTIAALNSSHPIADLEHILNFINKKS
ncbi:hypothetical protein O181_101544 [Austropuccinia psidii MF-1]|uniref:No apical meristem-associated C-terminal domain-containing protein n=1 Tax=Austropuccinia psidii MF-1 TaxID=1389203 RepID=A0A9Q3PHE5_9BASI|nr:hypothetical protein [Austropuccinia psidii MF-1]